VLVASERSEKIRKSSDLRSDKQNLLRYFDGSDSGTIDQRTRNRPSEMRSRLAACERCRKAKLACDHKRPVCTRCRNTNQAGICIYRDSPFKRKHASVSSPSVEPQNRLDNPQHYPRPLLTVLQSAIAGGVTVVQRPTDPVSESWIPWIFEPCCYL